jgi:hypothetical protein
MKLYVWENVLEDWTAGLVVALASSESAAREAISEIDQTAAGVIERIKPKVYDPDDGVARAFLFGEAVDMDVTMPRIDAERNGSQELDYDERGYATINVHLPDRVDEYFITRVPRDFANSHKGDRRCQQIDGAIARGAPSATRPRSQKGGKNWSPDGRRWGRRKPPRLGARSTPSQNMGTRRKPFAKTGASGSKRNKACGLTITRVASVAILGCAIRT